MSSKQSEHAMRRQTQKISWKVKKCSQVLLLRFIYLIIIDNQSVDRSFFLFLFSFLHFDDGLRRNKTKKSLLIFSSHLGFPAMTHNATDLWVGASNSRGSYLIIWLHKLPHEIVSNGRRIANRCAQPNTVASTRHSSVHPYCTASNALSQAACSE